ncbi:O-antigen ligase family protein [Anthocerotibacter panamensis]|uniref:O-antigen ligase family protein n=1 Tax=Anthocerotibacter panamensis TaxID=2857077 RepID=UPI001C4075CB|nr:O-antigen ligase family protein [Anthocerotibacter panamensis]
MVQLKKVQLKNWGGTLAVFLAVPLAVAFGIARNPLLTTGAGIAAFGVLVGLLLAHRLPRIFLGVITLLLTGYAFLGKGFAYLGDSPFFVGELTLLVGSFTLLVAGGLGVLLEGPLALLVGLFMLWGATCTFPHFGTYGLDTLRDGVLWVYGAFALIVAALLYRTKSVQSVPRVFAHLLPWFLVWAPVAGLLYRAGTVALPHLPGSPVPLLVYKSGDTAVHLAGAAVFILLGLQKRWPWRWEWLTWVFWFAGFAIAGVGRAAAVSVLAGLGVLLVLRPKSPWPKFLGVGAAMATLALLCNFQIGLNGSRAVSVEQYVQNFQSLVDPSDEKLAGSKEWRQEWWQDIVHYTFEGRYFWTGKGFGINLADADGYQVENDGSLRHPHNGHMNILARSGVPGLALWLLLQVTFGGSLLLAYFRSRHAGQEDWAKLNLWVLAYWTAFMVNASFDVYLEGPQGGIWFWSLMGFGIALLLAQPNQPARARRGRP